MITKQANEVLGPVWTFLLSWILIFVTSELDMYFRLRIILTGQYICNISLKLYTILGPPARYCFCCCNNENFLNIGLMKVFFLTDYFVLKCHFFTSLLWNINIYWNYFAKLWYINYHCCRHTCVKHFFCASAFGTEELHKQTVTNQKWQRRLFLYNKCSIHAVGRSGNVKPHSFYYRHLKITIWILFTLYHYTLL